MSPHRAAFAGQIADVPVPELLRTILEGRHSGVARFSTEIGSATVWFRDGQVIDAEMGRHVMEIALRRLLPLEMGTFEVEFRPVDRRRAITIDPLQLIPVPEAEALPPAGEDDLGPDDDEFAESPESDGDLHDASANDEHDAMGTSGEFASGAGDRSGDGEPAGASGGRPSPRRRRRAAGWIPTGGGPGRIAEAPGDSAPSDSALRDLQALEPHPPAPERAQDDEDTITRAAPGPRLVAVPSAVEALSPEDTEPTRVARAPAAPSGEPVAATPTGEPEPSASPPHDREPSADGGTDAAPMQMDHASAEALRSADPPPLPIPSVDSGDPAAASGEAPRSDARAPDVAGPDMLSSGGVPVDMMQSSDSIGIATDGPRRGPRRARRAAVPFSPERVDRTLMRPGPLPPAIPPAIPPASPPASPPAMAAPVPPSAPADEPPAFGPNDTVQLPFVDEGPRLGPGGTLELANADTRAPAQIRTGPSGTFRLGRTGPVVPGASASGVHAGLARTSAPVPVGPGGTFVLPSSPISRTDRRALAPPDAELGAPTHAVPGQPAPGPAAVPAAATPPAGPAIGHAFESADPMTAGAPNPVAWPDSPLLGFVPNAGTRALASVGRYEVLLRLARGGMGTVYLCRVTGEGGFRRLFALKVIRDHLSASPEYVAMLLQEARIASRLHHPNVVSIVDVGTLANQHYLVMDYVEGCTFSELLKAHPKSRPPGLVVPIVLDALTGLHAAHSLADDDGSALVLVHCDFSPQNMLVGTNGICRITDFGIAKASDALPERGWTRGKPGFLSPEQATGRCLDHRSDIFAAGVVLWNALTGETLFSGDTPEATVERVLQAPIPPPSTAGLRPPTCFDAICLRALERDPDRRYQSAEAMLIDLRRAAIAHDYLAPASDVARWVSETFGPQIEARRQAAGIAPRPVASQLRALGLQPSGPLLLASGHPSSSDNITATDDPSRTAMLRSDLFSASMVGQPPAAYGEAREGLGQRAKMLVFVLSALFTGACLAVLFLRPDWLRGGTVDDGRYVPWTAPAPENGEPVAESEKTPVTPDPQGVEPSSDPGSEPSSEPAVEPGAGALPPTTTELGGTATTGDGKAAVEREATPAPSPAASAEAPPVEPGAPANVQAVAPTVPATSPKPKAPKPAAKAKTPEAPSKPALPDVSDVPPPQPAAKPAPKASTKPPPPPPPNPRDPTTDDGLLPVNQPPREPKPLPPAEPM